MENSIGAGAGERYIKDEEMSPILKDFTTKEKHT